MIEFVLDCLTTLPLVIGHRVINAVILDALNHVVGQTRSKQALLAAAQRAPMRGVAAGGEGGRATRLHALGLLLGVQEWTEDYSQRLVAPRACVEIVHGMDVDMENNLDVRETH